MNDLLEELIEIVLNGLIAVVNNLSDNAYTWRYKWRRRKSRTS